MSLKPLNEVEPLPEETQALAKRMCPKGTLAMHLRDALGPIYQNKDFAHLFAKWGRPAQAPWRLALVTVLQAIEGLSDRQAAQYVQIRVDWLYALSLTPGDPGFDFSILSDFRQRLLDHDAADLLLEPILSVCREQGWLKARGKERTDSTMVLAQVRSLSSLESVGESMRAALNAIAEQEPDWLDEQVNPEWFDRYVHRFELARFPKEESKRAKLRSDVGQDVQQLLGLLQNQPVPTSLQQLPEIGLLRQIFAQHYEVKEGQAQWRDGPAVESQERVVSPYDLDARSSRKRDTTWLGYKVHLTETCDQDPACPHLVVNVETTPAPLHDADVLEPISDHLRLHDLNPAEQYVDQGYASGPELIEQEKHGTQILGPVPADGSWQHRAQGGYAVADFQLDWQQREAICPQGHSSLKWSRRYDERNQPVELIRFPLKVCQQCPVREQCTKGTQQGRTLNIHVQQVHEALEERRAEQFTPAFQKRYAIRAGIEGTISQGIRALGMRKTPSRGTAKTHLHHLAIAAGINLLRIDAHLQAQAHNKPTRPTRRRTPFARLQERRETKAA